MANAISANKAELIAIANSVASEKMIDKAIVIEAMEDAIQRAARARYGAENDIRAKLDPDSGDLRLWRVVEVVDVVEDYFKQVDIKAAQKLQKGAVVGDFIVDPLPPIDLGRIDAQSAKQVIFQKVRDAERERQFDEFKDRVGEIITGVVKSVEFGHVVVNLGRAEGVIRRDQQIPREVVRVGDRAAVRGARRAATRERRLRLRVVVAVVRLLARRDRRGVDVEVLVLVARRVVDEREVRLTELLAERREELRLVVRLRRRLRHLPRGLGL